MRLSRERRVRRTADEGSLGLLEARSPQPVQEPHDAASIATEIGESPARCRTQIHSCLPILVKSDADLHIVDEAKDQARRPVPSLASEDETASEQTQVVKVVPA